MSKPDLAAIVDLRLDVLEAPPLEKFHGAQCDALNAGSKFCNYIADGASLCAQTHSKDWWPFFLCMYSKADPNGDKDMDKDNPLASSETFDKQLTQCADKMKDYKVKHLKTCTYGEEGLTLRQQSAGKTPADKFKGPVWVDVGMKRVAAPKGASASRDQWQKDLVAEICKQYADQGGKKPNSCSQSDEVVV